VQKMRAAGKLAARVLEFAGTLVRPGVTTDEIDRAVHKMIIDNKAYPSPLNYGRFPKSVCTSVNECVCHGIPDSRPLQEGDIVNIDVGFSQEGREGGRGEGGEGCSLASCVGGVLHTASAVPAAATLLMQTQA